MCFLKIKHKIFYEDTIKEIPYEERNLSGKL